MEKVFFYQCKKCGNVIMTLNDCECSLVCCGEPMEKLVANSVEVSKEKHVPVAKVDGNKIRVTIGSDFHPMNADHYIEWIALAVGEKFEMVHLQPVMLPKATFTYESGQEDDYSTEEEDEFLANCEGQPCNFVYADASIKGEVYAYCNLHGLWKAEFIY